MKTKLSIKLIYTLGLVTSLITSSAMFLPSVKAAGSDVTMKITVKHGSTPVGGITVKCTQAVGQISSPIVTYGSGVTNASGLVTIVISNPPVDNMACYLPYNSSVCWDAQDSVFFDFGDKIVKGKTYNETINVVPNTTRSACKPVAATPTVVATSTPIPTKVPVATSTPRPTSVAVVTTQPTSTPTTEVTQTTTPTETPSATPTEETSNSSEENSSNQNEEKSESKNNLGSIIGLVCGGILLLAIIILALLLAFVKRFREKAKKALNSVKARFNK